MQIDIEEAEYVVDLIADDMKKDDIGFFDDWLALKRHDYDGEWEWFVTPTFYEGFPAQEYTVYWNSEKRYEEPMMILVIAKKPNDWAKGYVYMTNGRLKDYGKQVIVIFGMQVTGNKTEKYMNKKSDYDLVQAMLENEEQKQITLTPQSMNRKVLL